MRRLSICQFSTNRWSFHQDILKYASLDVGSVGIWKSKLLDVGAQEAADFLFEMKMDVSSLHWAGGFTGSEGNSYIDTVNDAIESVKIAGMLGAETLIVHPGARNGHTTGHAMRLLETALNSVAPVAADYGVRLALEPMSFQGKCPWTFMNGVDPVLQLISNFDAADVGIVLDLFHVGSQYEVLAKLSQFVDRIALVQLGDRNRAGDFRGKRCPLGTGVLPLADWIRHFEEIGYSGYYEIETWGVTRRCADYPAIVSADLAYAQEQLVEAGRFGSPTRTTNP